MRVGHVNFKSLTQWAKEKMATELSYICKANKVCDTCTLRKKNGDRFPSESWKEKKVLEFIHSNHCPLEVTSIGGKYYL